MEIKRLTLLSILLLPGNQLFTAEKDIDTGSITLVWMAEGIYAVEPNFAGAAGAVILNDSGNIVVDTHGTPASAKALIKAVSRISDRPIRNVINTHWHVDHHSGNEIYKAAYGDGVILIAHDETRKEIPTLGAGQFEQTAPYRANPVQSAEDALASKLDTHGQPLSAAQIVDIAEFRDDQVEFSNRESFDFTLPNLTYSKSITLHGSPNTVEIFFLYPGHTRADTIVYLRDQEILIIGDLLTKPILWSWSSYPASYIKTLKKLEQLPARKIVIGHGGPVLEDKSYLVQVRRFLETVVSFTEKSFATGSSEEVAVEAASTHEGIQQFRRKFVTEEEDGMFDQMVGWTVSRAYLEASNRGDI